MFTFPCPISRRPEQLAEIGMKKLRHCQPTCIASLQVATNNLAQWFHDYNLAFSLF